jgi:hypothetical protein
MPYNSRYLDWFVLLLTLLALSCMAGHCSAQAHGTWYIDPNGLVQWAPWIAGDPNDSLRYAGPPLSPVGMAQFRVLATHWLQKPQAPCTFYTLVPDDESLPPESWQTDASNLSQDGKFKWSTHVRPGRLTWWSYLPEPNTVWWNMGTWRKFSERIGNDPNCWEK